MFRLSVRTTRRMDFRLLLLLVEDVLQIEQAALQDELLALLALEEATWRG